MLSGLTTEARCIVQKLNSGIARGVLLRMKHCQLLLYRPWSVNVDAYLDEGEI